MLIKIQTSSLIKLFIIRNFSKDVYSRYLKKGDFKHNIFLIQPSIRYGKKKFVNSTPELRLQEAISLVNTLPGWSVKESFLINIDSHQSRNYFTSGIIESLCTKIRDDENITGVFIAADMLSGYQQYSLEQAFGVPVFDRYSIVIRIFRHYATSGEAKLQIALAEIPYLKARLREFHDEVNSDRYKFGIYKMGSGETFMQRAIRLLRERISQINKEIKSLSASRERLQKRRRIKEIPTVAVVGYTNSGKTSLIKAITQDEDLMPMDRLFATLDVTTFSAKLPSFQNVLFIDTIGFISDLPMHLIQAFKVTLKEIIESDLIVHIYDAHHPDLNNQMITVNQVLKELDVPEKLTSSMIHVANKIDLLDDFEHIQDSHFKISCTKMLNLSPLITKIDNFLLDNTNRLIVRLRVKNGGREYFWLTQETKIMNTEIDEDMNYLIIEAIMTRASRDRFISFFGSKLVIDSKFAVPH